MGDVGVNALGRSRPPIIKSKSSYGFRMWDEFPAVVIIGFVCVR